MTLDKKLESEEVDPVIKSNAVKIVEAIDKGAIQGSILLSKLALVSSILYAGSMFTVYAHVDSRYAEIRRHSTEINYEINYENFLNPFQFLKDNKEISEKGLEIYQNRKKDWIDYHMYPVIG